MEREKKKKERTLEDRARPKKNLFFFYLRRVRKFAHRIFARSLSVCSVREHDRDVLLEHTDNRLRKRSICS